MNPKSIKIKQEIFDIKKAIQDFDIIFYPPSIYIYRLLILPSICSSINNLENDDSSYKLIDETINAEFLLYFSEEQKNLINKSLSCFIVNNFSFYFI